MANDQGQCVVAEVRPGYYVTMLRDDAVAAGYRVLTRRTSHCMASQLRDMYDLLGHWAPSDGEED